LLTDVHGFRSIVAVNYTFDP